MRSRLRQKLSYILLAGTWLMQTGCAADFVGDQARQSLSSFITGVVTTAINEAINP